MPGCRATPRRRPGDGLHAQTGWQAFTRFLNDGRICLSNNAAERALRQELPSEDGHGYSPVPIAAAIVAAFMYSLIVTAKMNDIDPQTWLADVLRRIADHPTSRLHELLPWNWRIARRLAAQGETRAA